MAIPGAPASGTSSIDLREGTPFSAAELDFSYGRLEALRLAAQPEKAASSVERRAEFLGLLQRRLGAPGEVWVQVMPRPEATYLLPLLIWHLDGCSIQAQYSPSLSPAGQPYNEAGDELAPVGCWLRILGAGAATGLDQMKLDRAESLDTVAFNALFEDAIGTGLVGRR